MIDNKYFFELLKSRGMDFYTGVPDSLLKDLCAYVTDNVDVSNHVIAANEGNAIGVASGYHLATGKVPIVYMQNSGLGNAVNPLTSLTHKTVYSIPMLLIVGWRGGPYPDEPQHIAMGAVNEDLLKILDIDYFILKPGISDDDLRIMADHVKDYFRDFSRPFCFLVEKDAFKKYTLKIPQNEKLMSREDVLEKILENIPEDSVVVSTTGVCSREIWEIRERNQQSHKYDFLTVGSMGHASSIALGISMFTEKKVFCIDGDGSALMHLGSMGINADAGGSNFHHILINNACHDSVGGQPTVGGSVSFSALAHRLGYRDTYTARSKSFIAESIEMMIRSKGPSLLEIVNVRPGFRKDLGRPTQTPIENKEQFIKYLRDDK